MARVRPVILNFDPSIDGGRRAGGAVPVRPQAAAPTHGLSGVPAPGTILGRGELAQQVVASDPNMIAHSLMRVGNMPQTVVPPYTAYGTVRPLASRAERAAATLVIDPDPKLGGGTVVRLGNMTAERVREAAAAVDAEAPADMQAMLRASSVLRTVAQMEDDVEAPAPRARNGSANGVRHETARPLSALRQGPVSRHRHLDIEPDAPASPPSAAPGVGVTFEIEGYGTQTSYYHDVVVTDQAVVLCWLANYRGTKYFPKTGKELGLQVEGQDIAYLVHATEFVIPFGGYELCVLPIERGARVPPSDIPPPEE